MVMCARVGSADGLLDLVAEASALFDFEVGGGIARPLRPLRG